MIPHWDLFLVSDHTPRQVLAPPCIYFQHLEGPAGCKQKASYVFCDAGWLIIGCSSLQLSAHFKGTTWVSKWLILLLFFECYWTKDSNTEPKVNRWHCDALKNGKLWDHLFPGENESEIFIISLCCLATGCAPPECPSWMMTPKNN